MKKLLFLFLLLIGFSGQLFAQNKTDDIALEFAEMKKQFMNPMIAGHSPDLTKLK